MTRKRRLFVLQKEYCAPGTQTRIADIDNRFCREIESLSKRANFTQTICIWTKHVSNENNSATVIPTTRVECADIIIALKNVTLVGNKKSILLEMIDFAVTQVDNFCNNEFITVMFKLFDGKDASLVLFKPERYSNLSVQMLNYIFVAMTEQFVFCFCKSDLKLRFG